VLFECKSIPAYNYEWHLSWKSGRFLPNTRMLTGLRVVPAVMYSPASGMKNGLLRQIFDKKSEIDLVRPH